MPCNENRYNIGYNYRYNIGYNSHINIDEIKFFDLKNLKSVDQLNKGKDQHKIKITIDNKTAALP